ncbi:Uncharacterised protein [Nocardia otitidiscaviarum]|uniref:Uncharacterized protein n=1 Tax=Nocardia otitidiscaviarum TaxID=1823 RepID=A0A379JLY8_9NOCA|nr:hypothetical protein [Nocardia otitidiscaviarum]SUD49525.1 Uncharacterised protein [Nocardia otitidiscaviarum]
MVSQIVGVAALVALVALVSWLIGSAVARWVGALLVLDSLVSLAAALLFPGRLVVALGYLGAGLALWLCGHRLYLAKYGRWRSALAARAFALPGLRALVRPAAAP